jgi:hypothetical protein
MMHPHTRLIGLAAILICAAAVAIGTAGCGASAVTNAIDPVAKAATISTAAPGERITMSMRIESRALPAALSATGTGSFTPSARTGQMSLSMDFGSIPGLAQVLGSSTLTLRELIHGTTLYVGLPAALTAHLPGQRPWLELDLARAAAAQGIPGVGALIDNPTSSNPAQMLQYLRATGSVTRVGTATIGGRGTTAYRATIDLSRVSSTVPSTDRAAASRAIAALERLGGVKRIPVEVWIDSGHLVRQMRFSLNEHPAGTGQAVGMAMTLDVPQYGAQPTPKLPSAGQVTNLQSLLGRLGSGASGIA